MHTSRNASTWAQELTHAELVELVSGLDDERQEDLACLAYTIKARNLRAQYDKLKGGDTRAAAKAALRCLRLNESPLANFLREKGML